MISQVILLSTLVVAAAVASTDTQSPPPAIEDRSAFVLANEAPYFDLNLPLYLLPTTDIEYSMAIKVVDSNNDTVNVTWEWGDGSPNAVDVAMPPYPAWVNETHTWSVPREPGVGDYYSEPYLVNITLDDGMGGIAQTQKYAYVYVPPNGYPEMDLSAPATVEPGEVALIVANASDPEGEPLTWTFVFNDGVTDFRTEVYTTPATAPNETVWNNITQIFDVEGKYTVMLSVSDALPPNQVPPHNTSLKISIDARFNLPPEVMGVIGVKPQSLIINATIGYLEVSYIVEAFDPDGDEFYVTWDFGGGEPLVTNVSSGGKEAFIQQRNYTEPGIYNVSVVVSDNRPGHNVSLYKEVQIASNNLPPSLVSFEFKYSENRSFGLPNETIIFSLAIKDPELDAIEIILDFGDSSTLEYYNLTEFADGNVTLLLNHSYESEGAYQVTIWYTDNKIGLFEHKKSYNVTVTVKEATPITHIRWTTWDYVSLTLFISAFALPIIWAFIGMRRRRRLDMEGGYMSGLRESSRKARYSSSRARGRR